MNVLQEKTSLLNIQSFIVGKNIDSSCIGRYAFVKLHSHDRTFICNIWRKSFLDDRFCTLDPTVEVSNGNEQSQDSLDKDMTVGDIEVCAVNPIKSLNLTIIFKEPRSRLKWEGRETALIDSVKELLKLFVISSGSVIHLHRLKEFDLFGIHLMKISSIGVEGCGRVIKSTKIKLEKKISLITHSQLDSINSDYIFHEDAYSELKSIFVTNSKLLRENNFILAQTLQKILVIGPSGCGKCSVIHKACYDSKVVVLNLDLTEMLLSKYENRQGFYDRNIEVARSLSEETESGLCVILIRGIENVKSKSKKSVILLNSFLDRVSSEPRILIIATTDSPNSLDISLRTSSRFNVEIYLSIPSESERCFIVDRLLSSVNFKVKSCLEVARCTPGFVISDLVLLVRKASKVLNSDGLSCDEDVIKVLLSCAKSISPSCTKNAIGVVPRSDYSLDRLGGLDEIKNKLIQVIVWPIVHRESFERMNVPSPAGVLLYGPPGCAKTSLVRAIASSCKTTFLSVSAADLYSPFVGDAEKTITELFQRARSSAPTVLFIDEIDALVGSRTFREKGVQERVLSSFLTELDGVGYKKDSNLSCKYNPLVIVIAATNRPQMIDSALLRPGRFDKLIYVPPPSSEERHEILIKASKNLKIDKNLPLLAIAEKTVNFSGADLINLCQEAGIQAVTVSGTQVENINEEHFNFVLSQLKPSLSEDQITWYQEFVFS